MAATRIRCTSLRRQSWQRITAAPSLDLRFAETKSDVDVISGQNLITFTRASSGTFVDAAGVLQTAATNEARFDHDPTTGESLGLLVEEQRTNSIRNNTMQGAVAGTPGTLPTNWAVNNLGTLSQQIVGTGTINGIQYIDWRVSGTSSTTSVTLAFEPTTQVVAASGESWSISAYAARVGGSAANIAYAGFGIYERTSAGSLVAANNSPISLANVTTFGRVTYSATLAGGATVARVQPLLVLAITSGAAIDITLRIGLPQLEQGAFATSVIPTTGAAATRSADVASITGSNFSLWYNQSEGTIVCIGTSNSSSSDGSSLAISDGTNSNRIQLGTGASNTVWNPFVVTSGSTVATLTQSGLSPKTNAKLALAYKVNDFAATTAGVVPVADTSGAVPTVDSLRIGASGSGSVTWNSHIRRITYWPARLSDANLRALTQ